MKNYHARKFKGIRFTNSEPRPIYVVSDIPEINKITIQPTDTLDMVLELDPQLDIMIKPYTLNNKLYLSVFQVNTEEYPVAY
jgi:hypothetical protein